MSAVPPELAAKVDAANLRNHVKAVGEGATLPPATRQVFMTFAAKGDPDVMREARENALLQKWLSAGRLSKEERSEIEHILPSSASASLESAASTPPLKSNGYLRTADDYGHLGISRRKFFRWKSAGESAAAGPDLPPFDEPHQIEAWYDRMRAAGAFKHQFPKDVRIAIAEHMRGSPAPVRSPQAASSSQQATESPSPSGTVPSAFTADHGRAQGLQFEIAAEERRVASLRVSRDEAYRNHQRTEGDQYDRQYREALDALSLVHQRYLKIAEQEGRLVPLDHIEREFSPKLTSIVQGGMHLIDTIDAQLLGVTDRLARRAIWRKAWLEQCAGLVEGDFSPPLQLEALAA